MKKKIKKIAKPHTKKADLIANCGGKKRGCHITLMPTFKLKAA